MLTDRQKKFYDRICKLSISKEITRKERHYISKAKQNIDNDRQFGDSVNAMNLSLRIYRKNTDKSLSSDVQKLYDDLVKVYGEPDFRQLSSVQTKGTYGSGFQNIGWL